MDRPQTTLERALEDELYSSRVLILLECDTHFHQVALSESQLLKVIRTIESAVIPDPARPDMLLSSIRMRRECVRSKAFDKMRQWYTQEELLEMDKYVETHQPNHDDDPA